jgi:hypothetical protein
VFAGIFYQTIPNSRPAATLEEIAQGKVSTDYHLLRESFLKNAKLRGASLETHMMQAKGPQGESLHIDVAFLGNPNAPHALVHMSGTHGVEGYVGSAIQSVLLKKDFSIPENLQVIFIHAVNPYGMAFSRRVNESNVDINRNAVFSGEEGFAGAPKAYHLVYDFLNPAGPPSRIDMFYPLAVWNIFQHGFVALKQAIGGGQYDFPKGIYFGGNKVEESTEFLKNFFLERLAAKKKVFVLEVHTGLGDWGKDVLFWPLPDGNEKTIAFSKALQEKLSSDEADKGVGFETPGDLQKEIPKFIPAADTYWILQEFGAYGPVRTLRALRDENRYHQSGGRDVQHWSKRKLVDAFSPADEEWQRMVVARGVELFEKMMKLGGQSVAPSGL